MKRIHILTVILAFLILSCNSDKEDNRAYEAGNIVAVLLDDAIYTPVNKDYVAEVKLPPGVDLSYVRLNVLATNGTLSGITPNLEKDVRFPIPLHLSGFDGTEQDWTLKIISPPLLNYLYVEGLYIPKQDIHFNANKLSIVVQIPVGTDLSGLKVTPEFVNGTLVDFNTGTADYSQPVNVKVKGVDNTTIYTYKLVFTDEEVGPASIKAIKVNGEVSDSVVLDPKTNTLQPYFTYLNSFHKADVSLELGFNNNMDPNFTGKDVNLLESFKVKVTGSNGVDTEFTIATPLIVSKPIVRLNYPKLQYNADAGSSAGFSNGNIVIACHSMAAGATAAFGINAYSLSGGYLNGLSKVGSNIDGGAVNGIRKLATDDDGTILGVQLGAGAALGAELKIYKWDDINAKPSAYLTYSASSLGLSYAARAAGINVTGSLKGNAIITVGIAQNNDVLIWKVTNGVLNPTPTKMSLPSTNVKTSYYYSVAPFEDFYVAAITGSDPNFSGLLALNASFTETFKLSVSNTTDLKLVKHNGRTYCAYTVFAAGKGHIFRISDVTNNDLKSYQTFIMNITSLNKVGNGNNTLDSDFAVINGKLHVLFFGTNDGLYVYQLEK